MRNNTAFRALNALACLWFFVPACTRTPEDSEKSDLHRLVLISDVDWKPLNPARGDRSPKAGALWGDRTSPGSSGFLVEFSDGFSSPPHIHNVTYRGVVIDGFVHNDDPEAESMYMPAGSYWSQPAGDVHITAARGSHNLAYIEIESGPYLVLPVEDAFSIDEPPKNVPEWEIDWAEPLGRPSQANGPKVVFPWEDGPESELSRALIKVPAGSTVKLSVRGESLHAVIIRGRPSYQARSQANLITLEPGSSFSLFGESSTSITSEPEGESLLYVRVVGEFDVALNQ